VTRFVYISDTHWGSSENGYKVQPKYGDKLPELLSALTSWIDENGPVDFVLHGGDVIHETSETNIKEAAQHFDLPIPVHLCVGNHDLTVDGGIEDWLRLAPEFFTEGSPNYGIDTGDCWIHVIPNHYGAKPYLWEKIQDYHFLDTQIEALERRIESTPDAPHLVLTHCPILPITQDQSGLPDPFHSPPESFTRTVTGLAEKYGVRCVLGAHSHVNMNKELNGVNYITVSSFVEAPFEFKLFEIGSETISMQTHNLWKQVDFPVEYNWNKTFAQGRTCDRSFEIEL
jgi:predicted MPP superfamily phosphohydrolase